MTRFLIAVAFSVVIVSCNKDDESPPYVVNNSVHPADFLTEKSYNTLEIEVAYVDGYEPSTNAINALINFLSDRVHKSGGIKITKRVIPATGKFSMDVDAVRAYEKSQRQSVTKGKNLTAWLMFVDTEYSESTATQKVLGLTYGASSMVIFEKSIYAYAQPSDPVHASLETVVLTHEFGHIFGLVNNGTSMVTSHQDSDHGAHCSNTDCLMYWKTEQNVTLTDILGQDKLPALDANCLADLKAAGGK